MAKEMDNSVTEFFNKNCCLPFVDPYYEHPTPEDIKYLQKLNGWTHIQMAKLVGVTFNEKSGSSTIRKWCTKFDSPEYRAIPYSAWRLLLSYSSTRKLSSEAVTILGTRTFKL